MSRLEPPREDTADADEHVAVSIDGVPSRLSLPASASRQEAAAMAAAIGAHLTDRQRAAVAAVSVASRGRRTADPWRLAGRLGDDRPDRWIEIEEGEEWRAASRRY